ncbi:hypothetical protein ET33_13545 [Paenibacillus tyrfis]|uniref:Uncharacterized protein n=2 Tax=Paenibacillus tyrfis TaxID=1501230 RepID=A0A081PAI1_9BACL|nr:hypothetical protein ET33_13545 [Paenibacillus tyrfis]
MENFWDKKKEFSKVLSLILDVKLDSSAKTTFHRYIDYFINYTIVFLIKKNDDFLQLFSEVNDKSKRATFMDRYFSNDLISYEMVCKILNDEELIKKIGLHHEWIEYPLMLRTSYLLSISKERGVDETDIIPCELDLDCSFKEYLLSWSFEEKKLSKKGIDYFKKNFENKYNQLCKIMGINP